MSTIAKYIVPIAIAEVGVTEIRGTNCGPRVNQYKAATNLPADEPWPWCAAFVDWCVREAMLKGKVPETAKFKRPTTAGAWDLENWSKRQDNSTQTKRDPGCDIKAGDIVIYRFSHVGIAIEDANKETGTVVCAEGNTDSAGSREGGGVFRKVRSLSKVKSRIRFTV